MLYWINMIGELKMQKKSKKGEKMTYYQKIGTEVACNFCAATD